MNYEEKKIFERIAGNLGDISLWLLILCITQCAQCARAESINVTLFRVHSPLAVNDAQYDSIILGTRNQYRRDLNVGLRIRQKHIYNATGYMWDPDTDLVKKALYLEFYRWASWGDARRLVKKRSYGWIVQGAETPGGLMYSWGLAQQGCSKNTPRYFVATAVNNNGAGKNRLDFSSKVVSHELGHTVNASHPRCSAGGFSLMCSELGTYYQQDVYIPFSPFSVAQIKKCLKG